MPSTLRQDAATFYIPPPAPRLFQTEMDDDSASADPRPALRSRSLPCAKLSPAPGGCGPRVTVVKRRAWPVVPQHGSREGILPEECLACTAASGASRPRGPESRGLARRSGQGVAVAPRPAPPLLEPFSAFQPAGGGPSRPGLGSDSVAVSSPARTNKIDITTTSSPSSYAVFSDSWRRSAWLVAP